MLHVRPEIERLAAGEAQRRVTVVRTGGIGDTLLALPALRILREALPEARVTLVGSRCAQELLPLLRRPPEFLRYDSTALTPLFAEPPARDPAGIFAGADVVIIYTADSGGALVRNAERLCPGPVLPWPVQPPEEVHAACHFASALLAGRPSSPAVDPPALRVPPEEQRWADGWLAGQAERSERAPVAVHPGSGGQRKTWPAERFARLVRTLRERGVGVLMVEGPADREACGRVREQLPEGADVWEPGRVSLVRCAALLSRCDAYVGNDSGISHLAAALGLSTVVVFGPTDPRTWRPPGPAVRVVQADAAGAAHGCRWPQVEAVSRALGQTLPHGRRTPTRG